jgi:hypothetical protein
MVKVGDKVLWRKADKPNMLGVAGCKVTALGKTEDGQDAAEIEFMGQRVNALVADLQPSN